MFILKVDVARSLEVEVVRKPGFVLSVGENLSNQLGLGDDISERKKPQLIKLLPTNIVEVQAGGMHSACLTADGIVISKKLKIYFIDLNTFMCLLGLHIWL